MDYGLEVALRYGYLRKYILLLIIYSYFLVRDPFLGAADTVRSIRTP